MKPVVILIMAILLFTQGCSKKDAAPAIIPNQQVVIKTFDKKTAELHVDTKQGYVTLNIEELPGNVTSGDPAPVTGNTPFKTGLSLSSQNAVAGKYTFKLVSFKDGLTDSFHVTPVDLTIEPFSENECNGFFNILANGNNSGAFVQDSAGTRGFKEQPHITLTDGQLAFDNLVVYYLVSANFTVSKASAPGQHIPFDIHCESGSITIPPATATDADGKSYKVTGSGVIDYETQSYVITYISGGQTMLLQGSIDYDAYFSP